MKVVDLTHLITADMPVYPGTEKPKLMPANTYEQDGFRETLLTLYSHTGTHMDSPGHLFATRTTLDDLPASHFIGQALSVDCRDVGAGGRITMAHLEGVRHLADRADFLLFNTGWDQYWQKDTYFGDFPVITEAVVTYILETGKKGIGIDTIGIDRIQDEALPLHKQLMQERDVIIIENLTRLDQVGRDLFLFCALPLHFFNADGAPARAVGVLDF